MSMDKINCCKGCEKRSVGCHSACPEYRLEWDALTKRNELQIQASLARHDRYYADHFNKARKKAKYVNGLKSKTRYW